MHNPSHPGYYDRGPPTHFPRNWNEHGYTPPYRYAKQHNGHHARQFHPHHSNYHYDWHNHHAPPFHRPPYHSNPPPQIIHNHWRHAPPQAVPKIIIQRSSINEEKGKVLRLSGNSKSPPLYHVKTNSPAISAPSSKDCGEINLPQERKILSGRKDKKVKKDASANNETLSELKADNLALNVVISNCVSDKEIMEVSLTVSEGIPQNDINPENPSGQEGSSKDATVTHSKNGCEVNPIHSNSDICLSKDSLNNFSNPLTDREKKDDSKDLKIDFSVKDNTQKMEFNVGKSYNMKNCKRNSLVKLKKRYPELQKLFGKDPLIKLQRLSAAKIASYESNKFRESKGHIFGSVGERKGLELNKENKSIKGISVDPKVMSLSRALQNPPNGKKPVDTIFKCTVARLKSANPFPKSKRSAPKISYTDISKLKMKLKNVEVPRSPNISSKTSHNIKSINPEPSIETNQKGNICLDVSSVSSSVSLNELTQEHTVTMFYNEELSHITAFKSDTKDKKTEMQTCNTEISRTETEKCNVPGKVPTSSQKNTLSDQILSESMPALTIRRNDQMQENGKKLTDEINPSPLLLEPQVVSECSSLGPVEGQSYASNLGRKVDSQGDSLRDKTILKLVKEKIMQKKETVRHSNSVSDMYQGTFQSESFDDRQKDDTSDSRTLQQRGQGEEHKSGYDQRQVSSELHASCSGDKTVEIDQSDRNNMALCSKSVIPERQKDSISCLPSNLENSVTGASMQNSIVAMDSTPYSAGEELRTSEANQTVLGSRTNRVPVWQYNCSEEMLIAADTLLSVGNLPACGATETVGNENYPIEKSGFYQTEYVMCPEETVGLDLTVNSNITEDNTIVDSVNSNDVTENCDACIEGDNSLVKRKRLKVGKREKVNMAKFEKHGEEEESQACDSDATYIYSDSGEDSTMNQVIERVQERDKDGSLPSESSKKLSDSKNDSESTKLSSNTQKANRSQKKGREKSKYEAKSRAKGSSSQLVENNNVSNVAEQTQKRKLSQNNNMVIKRKRTSPSLKVVIGNVDSAKVNEGQVNKNAEGENKNDSSRNVSESKEIKGKKAKDSKKIPAEENVNVRKRKSDIMKKDSDAKDLKMSIDKSDRKFPDIVQSGCAEEEAEEIKKSVAIRTKTEVAKGTDGVSRRGKRPGGRRGGITRSDIFQEDTGSQQSAQEGKARRGKGSRGGRGRGQKKFTRVVKCHGKDLQIHLNEVLHHGEDSDDLPTILPPKRRRRPQHAPSPQSSDKIDRIMAEFPKHNWLITKYQSEPEDLSLCDSKKKAKVQLNDKTAEDIDSAQPLSVLENLGTDQKELQSLDLPTNHHEPEKENKDNDEVTDDDSFDSPLYIDMDSVNEKEVDEDSPTPKQHPLDLCVKKNDKTSVTFRQHSNPPVQLVHPHVHRPPTTVSSILLRDTKHVLSNVVVSSQSSDTTQGIVTKIAADWSTSATGSTITGTNDELISEIIDLGKSIQVPKNLLKHGSLPSPFCTDTSDVQVLHNSFGEKEAISDTKLESNESEAKFVQPAIPRLIPASSIVPGSNFSPAQHSLNRDIVLLPVSLGPSTDILPDVDQREQNASNSQMTHVEKAVSLKNGAVDVLENRNLLTSQERTPKVGGNDEQLYPSTLLCSSSIQMTESSNETNIVSLSTNFSAITPITSIICSSLLPEEHSASLIYNAGERITESTLVASHLSQGSIPATSIGSTKLSNESDIDICDIESNIAHTKSESISSDIFVSAMIPEFAEKKNKIEMQPNSSVKYKTPSSECKRVGAGVSTHTKILKTDIYFSDKNNAVGVIGNVSENMAYSALDMTEGESPTKKYCEYPSSKEPPPLMMAQTLVDAQSVSPNQTISSLANDNTMHICSPVHNEVAELDPDIQKQMEELDQKIKQNEKEKEEMLNAKRKIAELMERKKKEKLEEQVKVMSKEQQQQTPIKNLPVQTAFEIQDPLNDLPMSDSNQANLKNLPEQTAVGIQDPLSDLPLSDSNQANLKNLPEQTAVGIQDPLSDLPLSDSNQANLRVSNSHQEQIWSRYQTPLNEPSFLEQESAALQEPNSDQQQELPQPFSREKQTPYQLPISLHQPPMKQDQQQKQKEQERTTDQLLVRPESFQQQATPRSQNMHEQQQQNIPDQQHQSSQQQRRSIPQHTLLHDKSSLFQQPSSPAHMSQTSQVLLQRQPLTERASQSHSLAENILSRTKPQQPLSQQQNQTSLKHMVQMHNPQQQNIQGPNVPRQQLLQQQLFSCQQPNQIAGNQFQQQQLVSQQRFHLHSPLLMQPSQAAQMQSPTHLQHGFQNQYHPSQHPSLSQQQQYSRTQQQNYYNHQAQLQPQQQFQQNCVKNQTQSQPHSIAPGHSSVQTVKNLQRTNMHQQQMQQYQQVHMQQQQQQQPRPQLFQARPSNFGNTFQIPSSQQHEMQSVVMQNSSNEHQCNLNQLGPKSMSPSSAITGTANVTPTIPRQINLAMQEAQKRKQFGLPEIQPAHCNNEKSMLRRDSEPPPPAHMNCVSLKKLMRKMDRNAMKLTSAVNASCPYLQRNEPITCPPLDGKRSGSNEMKVPAKAHSQPPFNIAGKLIVQQLPGKAPSINRTIHEDKETARHSSVPNTPTSATLGVQLPPRASSATEKHLQRSQSISEIGQPTFMFHPDSLSSASLSRSSSQSVTNLSMQEESKLTDKGNTPAIVSLNSQQKFEGSVKFTNASQTLAPPAIQSQDVIATPNIDNTNIIDLTKEFSTVPNDLQKDDTEKAVQLELNKAIAKRCKQDLMNATMTGEDWTLLDQQLSKVSHQTQGMKLPLGPSNTIVLTVDNQPHAQQASLQVSPVLVSTPTNVIPNQQQQWQRVNEEMNGMKSVVVSPPQKQLPVNQGPGLTMRPSSGMQVTTVSNMLIMQTPSNRLSSGQAGRMPQLLPKTQNPMIRMIGSAAVPIHGGGIMPPTTGNVQINRPDHPQAVMMQGPYRMNQQHLHAQRQYQNPEIMKHRTRQYIGAQRAGIMPPQQIPHQSSVEINQDSNSCAQPVQQQPPLNPSAQTNAFNQNRQKPQQIAPSPQQAFVPMSYQRQTTSSQARFAPMATYVNSSGHGQHMHTQNSLIMGNEQLPNQPGKMGNTAPQTNPVTSTSQPAKIVSTSPTKTTISTHVMTSVVPSEHPVTSQTSNMIPKEVEPTSNKTEAHLQQINGSCVMCGNFSLYLCSCCKKMWYCSPRCQLMHWTTHSQECRESTTT
ncbi:hypothetical protein CHS0354_034731 [Potamilus streckersoni]|nr:hypothetical protein CHS0354_034731 [Potamilus streckersoni]